MSLRTFLVKPFDTTHENKYFRGLSLRLQKEFKKADGSISLIGNISCAGDQLDAVFIKDGALVVLDFKNYGGALHVSENTLWSIESEKGEKSFVGGGRSRNPFQQLVGFRNSFIDFMVARKSDIFPGRGEELNLRHANAMVVFHRPVKIVNPMDLPRKAKYFSVEDDTTIAQALKDAHSKNLHLNDVEHARLIKALGVSDDIEYNPSDEGVDTKEAVDEGDARLQFIRKRVESLLNIEHDLQRVLAYCEVMLDMESYKEAKTLRSFIVAGSEAVSGLDYDFSISAGLMSEMTSNKRQKFPKDVMLGVGLEGVAGNEPLLMCIEKQSEVTESGYSLSVTALELNEPLLRAMDVPEDQFEDMEKELHEVINAELLRRFMERWFNSSRLIYLAGLADRGLTQVSTISELKKLREKHFHRINDNSVLNAYVMKRAIHKGSEDVIPKMLEIAEVDKSQLDAIRECMKQPLTVITGPPGTGKSQIILNIIATAVANGMRVLFASKNNQAVETVRERMSSILEKDVFFKYGSKSSIKNEVYPKYEAISNNLHVFRNYNPSNLDEVEKQWKNYDELRQKTMAVLSEYEALPNIISTQVVQLANLELQWKNLRAEYTASEWELYVNRGVRLVIDQMILDYWLDRIAPSNIRLLTKVWLAIYGNKQLLASMRSLKTEVVRQIGDMAEFIPSTERPGIPLRVVAYEFMSELARMQRRSKSCSEEAEKLSARIAQGKDTLAGKKERYAKIKALMPQINDSLPKIESNMRELSRRIFNLHLDKYRSSLTLAEIERYKYYVPDNIPWQYELIPDYVDSAMKIIDRFRMVSVTNLSVKNSFPLESDLFDLLIVDEASQCDIASAIPLLYRAKSAVIIGDPLQLRHITRIEDYEESYLRFKLKLERSEINYIKQSLFDYSYSVAQLSNLQTFVLDNHYRCHPNIIEFSNRYFYQRLIGRALNVRTSDDSYDTNPKGFIWLNTPGMGRPDQNSNINEVDAVVRVARKLAALNPGKTIGVVTPFNDQKRLLKAKFENPDLGGIVVDTVYKYQGDERDIIIFSTVVTANGRQSGYRWINNMVPYLINVAVTRARSLLVVVGDHQFCSMPHPELVDINYIKYLADYANELNAVKDQL